MKLSVSLTNYTWPVDAISGNTASLAQRLDDTAVDTLWVADHLLQADPASRLDNPMLEAYTTLGFLAAQTKRLRLGTMVTAATFRAPALLIKAVTTLDVLSGGRAWLGVGGEHQGADAGARRRACRLFHRRVVVADIAGSLLRQQLHEVFPNHRVHQCVCARAQLIEGVARHGVAGQNHRGAVELDPEPDGRRHRPMVGGRKPGFAPRPAPTPHPRSLPGFRRRAAR